MKIIHLYLLAILSGLLLAFAWPIAGFAPFVFLAFIPLLKLEFYFWEKVEKSWWNVLGLSYISFFLWNILVTFWVYNSTAVGGILAFTLNSLFMAIVFTCFHLTHKKFGHTIGYTTLICLWISYEFLHQDWDLSWTWLILGNVFSENFKWIQWYEFTGFMGGTLWVWVVNVLLFWALNTVQSYRTIWIELKKGYFLLAISLISFPIALSYFIYNRYTEVQKPIEIVVVQPNIDPYNEKYDGMTASEQLIKLLRLAETKITTTTNYVVGPETALIEGIVENNIESFKSIQTIRQFVKAYPTIHFVVGISSYREYLTGETPSKTARTTPSGMTYDAFNTAIQIDTTNLIQIYHKSKLVPGVEKLPFPKLLKPLEELAFNLGGMSGSLGIQDHRSVFFNPENKELKIAPVVCYESIYGEYVGQYVKNGAGLIFIITNDGWWGDTPGYRQHCSYARLRAIEHRRSIARSANTGISCFINQKGEMLQSSLYWKAAVLKETLNVNSTLTFYTRYGDYIARVSMGICFLLLLVWTSQILKK